VQWIIKEDLEPENRMHEKMMESTGMGAHFQMQQQMTQQYANPAPASC
jgi:hypothetical protein